MLLLASVKEERLDLRDLLKLRIEEGAFHLRMGS